MNTSYLALGAIAAGVSGCWGYIKNFFAWIRGMALIKVSIMDGPLEGAVRLYCTKNMREGRLGTRAFRGTYAMVHAIHRTQLIGMETLAPQGSIYWDGGRPLFMSRVVSKEGYSRGCSLTFIRWFWDVDDFMQKVVQYHNDNVGSKISNFQRHRVVYVFGKNKQKLEVDMGRSDDSPSHSIFGGYDIEDRLDNLLNNKILIWKSEDLVPPRYETSLGDLALGEEAENLVGVIKQWSKSEQWFLDHRVPWKMGALLYGQPGCGKTALLRALAQDLDFPIYVYDLSSLTNEEFQAHWSKMLSNTPCIALIEDIDAVFDGRKNVTGIKGGMTFDALLNGVDGIERCDGLFLAITTNKIETVDPAIGVPDLNKGGISTRPGRIDRVIEMTKPDKAGRTKIASRILEGHSDLIPKVVDDGHEDTGAQFQERCTRIALERHWGKEEKSGVGL